MKKTFLVVSILLALAMIALAVWRSVIFVRRTLNPYLDVEIAQQTQLSNDWIELRPAEPIVVRRQVQLLVIILREELKPDYRNRGLLSQDGSLLEFQVQLIDTRGQARDLRLGGLNDSSIAFRDGELSEGTEFSAVRIRTNRNLTASRIYWRCSNSW